jgi:hypothetical protein
MLCSYRATSWPGGASNPCELDAGKRRVELLFQAVDDRRQHVVELPFGGHLQS